MFKPDVHPYCSPWALLPRLRFQRHPYPRPRGRGPTKGRLDLDKIFTNRHWVMWHVVNPTISQWYTTRYHIIIEGSLKVKHTTIWTDGKCRGGKTQRRERVSRNKIKARERVEKSRKTVFFPLFCGSGESKSKLAKAAGGCGAIWGDERSKIARCCGAKHMWKSTNWKTQRIHSIFGSWDVEKVHTVVVCSTFGSQNG